MTTAGAYRTSKCTAHGHQEFTLQFGADVPVPNLEQVLRSYFEDAVAQGLTFKPGQTVQLGWSTLRLTQRADGTLGVLEPDRSDRLTWVESVHQSLFESWGQNEVLRRLKLEARANHPRQAFQAIVCGAVWTSQAFVLGRSDPSHGSDSGWFVGCVDEAHNHEAPEALSVVPLIELAVRLPRLTAFFALPVGTDVMVSGMRERIFVDGEERVPEQASDIGGTSPSKHST